MKTILSLLAVLAVAFSPALYADSNDIKETAAGTVIGRRTDKKIAFHGSAPVAQRASADQAAVTTTVGAAVVTTAATSSTPFGYSQAQADALVARVNQLRADVLALTTLLNELRAAQVEKGLIKGSN